MRAFISNSKVCPSIFWSLIHLGLDTAVYLILDFIYYDTNSALKDVVIIDIGMIQGCLIVVSL